MRFVFQHRFHETEKESCTFIAVGDICTAFLPEYIVANGKYDRIYSQEIFDLLHDKDFSIGNLECPLSSIKAPISKIGPNLSASPETLEVIKQGGFNVVVLANNHIMDQGAAALEETITTCDSQGLKTVGAGKNIAEATEPLILEIKGITIALLAFAEEEFSSADDVMPGTAMFDLTLACKKIMWLKTQVDLVIVNVHGGNEMYPLPSPRMQNAYRFLVDCGAGAIIGHHPHTIQGIEIYNGAPILYSLGNFIFPYRTQQSCCWYEGAVARLTLGKIGVHAVEIFPCRQINNRNRFHVDVLAKDKQQVFQKRLARYSNIVTNPKAMNQFWDCFCFSRRGFYINALKASSTGLKGDFVDLVKGAIKQGHIGMLPVLLADFLSYLCQKKSTREDKINLLRNLLFCQAHHEVLSNIIEMDRCYIYPDKEAWKEFRSWASYLE